MTTMIAEVYDALREAGASEERSRAAAQTLASHEERVVKIDQQFDSVRTDIREVRTELKGDIRAVRTELKGDIRLLQWQVGLLIAGVVALVSKAFLGSH